MKKKLKPLLLVILVLLVFNCSEDDTITPTLNTSEYFKYSINNGPERIFDTTAKGYYTSNTNNAYDKFFFRAGANSAASIYVDGDFTFQNMTTFINTNNFSWGISDGVNAKFYFTELTPGNVFFSDIINLPTNPVECIVTVHPTNVGDYLEFTFQGEYISVVGNLSQGTVSGSGRIYRLDDQ
ncbi:hypothetical protein [Lacinutrix undariae]